MIIKIFKDTGPKIAFTLTDNIRHILQPKPHDTGYDIIGIYKLKFGDCDKVYVHQTSFHFTSRTSSTRMYRGDQTSRTINTAYKKHTKCIKKWFWAIKTCWIYPQKWILSEQQNIPGKKTENAIPMDELMERECNSFLEIVWEYNQKGNTQ